MKDFFADPKFQEELHIAVAGARDHLRTLQPPPQVRLGDAFLFAETVALPVRWITVLKHRHTPNNWYLIAADEFPLIGINDLELPESAPQAPLALRCGVGFWAHGNDIQLDFFVGQLGSEVLADAQDRLSEMELGEVPIAPDALNTEADEEYRGWISELQCMVDQIERRIRSEKTIRRPDTVDILRSDFVVVAEPRNDYATSLTEVSEPQSNACGPLFLNEPVPGRLEFFRLDSAYELRFFPVTPEQAPPPVTQVGGGDMQSGNWVLQSGGDWRWSQLLKAINGRLAVRIGNKELEIPREDSL